MRSLGYSEQAAITDIRYEPTDKGFLGRSSRRLENNIKMDLTEIGGRCGLTRLRTGTNGGLFGTRQ